MDWFNYYGLVIMVVIMVPNIVYALKHMGSAESVHQNKVVQVLEQIGRYACMFFMVFNIPYFYFNFWFDYALIVYLSVNGVLCLLYIFFWIVCWNKDGILKAVSLSILPSVIFLFSGVVLANILLIVFSILFGINHVYLRLNNYLKSN